MVSQEKVMVFGSFDIIHDGHRYLFKKAKFYGNYLLVIVARDERYKELRAYLPLHNEYERLKGVAEEKLVDEALLGETKDVYKLIRIHKPRTIVLGYDQTTFTDGLREQLDNFGLAKTKIVRIDAYKPEEFKSSILKKGKG